MSEVGLKSIEHVPLILLTIEADGIISHICGGELKRLEIDVSAIIGEKAMKIKSLPIRRAHIKKALSGETFSATSQIGDVIYEAFYHPFDDGEQTKVHIYIADVTSRVDTELRLDEEIAIKTKALETTKNDLKEILDHMRQGIITFDSDLIINDVSSLYTKTLVANSDLKLTGTNILESIFSGCEGADKIQRLLDFNLHVIFGADDIQWISSESAFPKEIEFLRDGKSQSVKLNFEPIYDSNDIISRMMLVMEDITLFKQVSLESQEKQQKLQKIGDLINVDEKLYHSFIEEVGRIVGECNHILDSIGASSEPSPEHITSMLRYVHTLKGSADLFKLSSIEEKAHEVETFFVQVKSGQVEVEGSIIPHLKKQIQFIEDQVTEYQELRNTVFKNSTAKADSAAQFTNEELFKIQSVLSQFSQLIQQPKMKLEDVDSMLSDMNQLSNSIGMSYFREYIINYDQMIQEIAAKQGKRVKPILLKGDFSDFESRNLSSISDMLIHCVRNSMNHGIENVEERLNKGKEEEGQITISSFVMDGDLVLEISDDGNGVDPEIVAAKAIENGFLSQKESQALSEQEKVNLIFTPGFSTQEALSVVAGRGVGMDAVKDLAEQMNGSAVMTSKIGEGATVTIRVSHEGLKKVSGF